MDNTAENKEFLSVKNLKVEYFSGKTVVHAVNGVDLKMYKGKTLGLVGETGAGKTTIAKSILRILPDVGARIVEGEIKLDGKDLLSLKEHDMRKIRGNEISMIFQDPMTALNPLKKIGSQLEEVILRHSNLSRQEAKEKAIEMLRKVGIPVPEQRIKQYPHEFSGGMRQRVLIAMALACEPQLLIADEPTTALDVTIQAQILDLLKELEQEYHTSIVLITHDMGVVATVCSKIAIMYGGLIMENGMTDEIFYNPKHPYTKALLRAIPSLDLKEGERLQSIDGVPPSLIDPPVGCPFAERCEYATERCYKEMPKYKNYSETHRAMCFLNEQE